MSEIYIAGSDLRFELTILRDGVAPGAIDPLSTVTLHYIAPDCTIGTWAGTIDDAAAGTVHKDVAAILNANDGRWTVWAEAIFLAGSKLITSAATVVIHPEGTVSP